jgi:hypothetical protein
MTEKKINVKFDTYENAETELLNELLTELKRKKNNG